ncbi:hypothetical protein [Nioella nitratireducens]|uniref:hypothetical protein n=1 Tax=Nioella nitratireducens TaxID=1287720 RepID=UPI0008FD4784|nr:hypothetical protein [Nioella nitratireducens]
MTRLSNCISVTILTLLAAPPVAAESPLTLVGMSVYRYDSLIDHSGDSGSFCCAPYVLGDDAGDFYYIRAIFDVAWSDDLDRVSVNSSDILLTLPDDEEGRRAVGRYDWYGIYNPSADSISERRPRDWPEETAQAFLNGIWYLPAGSTSATLTIGEADEILDVPVNLAVEVSPVIQPSQTMLFALRGISRVDEMTSEVRYNGTSIPGHLAASAGQILRVAFDATPAFSTDTDAQQGENRAFLRNSWFTLVGPDGAILTLLGSQSSATSSPRIEWTYSSSWDSEPPTRDAELAFLGAGMPGTYRLYFLEDMIGEVVLP